MNAARQLGYLAAPGGSGRRRRGRTCRDLDVGVHVGEKNAIRIGELDTHGRSAPVLVDLRVYELDLSGKGSPWQAAYADRHVLTDFDGAQVVLGNIGQPPDHRDVGDAKEDLAGRSFHALDRIGSSTSPSRGADQTIERGTVRVRSISAITYRHAFVSRDISNHPRPQH